MTDREVMQMAREAGLTKGQHWNKHNMTTEFMCDFANLVAGVEREEILQMSRGQWFKTQAEFEAAIEARYKHD